MDIKSNIKKTNNSTYFYKCEESVHIGIVFSFVFKTSKINNLKAVLLCKYLHQINEKYKTLKELNDKKEELYSTISNGYTSLYNDYSLVSLNINFLDPKRVKDNYFNDLIDFYKQLYYHPYFLNGKMDKDRFNLIKDNYYNRYVNFIKDIHFEYQKEYTSTVLKDSLENYHFYESKEELREILDSITDKDIIDFYDELIENHYKTLIFGNLNENEVKMIEKSFRFKESNIKKVNQIEKLKIEKAYNEYISKEFTQSILKVTYNIKDFDKYSNEVYSLVLSYMSNSMEGLLLGLLRGKHGLVYDGHCFLQFRNGIFYIEANIDKKNKDKVLDAIREYISDMHDKKKVEDKLNIAKNKIKEVIYISGESTRNIESSFNRIVMYNNISDREFIRQLNKITVEDIIGFFDNLENENIFYYVGDKNE